MYGIKFENAAGYIGSPQFAPTRMAPNSSEGIEANRNANNVIVNNSIRGSGIYLKNGKNNVVVRNNISLYRVSGHETILDPVGADIQVQVGKGSTATVEFSDKRAFKLEFIRQNKPSEITPTKYTAIKSSATLRDMGGGGSLAKVIFLQTKWPNEIGTGPV